MLGTKTKVAAPLAAVVWLFAASEMALGEQTKAASAEIALPAEAAGWAWDGKELRYGAQTLYEYMNGAAELYLTYGFQNLRVRTFGRSGQPPITVEFYEMASSQDAYGLFSFERQDEGAGIGQGSEYGGGLLRFWKGRYFVSIYPEGEGPEVESAVLAVGRATADSIHESGPAPQLPGFLPGKDFGLVDRSVRYLKSHILLNQRFFLAHQNILHLGRQTEAVLAQYDREGQKVHVLLVRYPDEQDAKAAYQSFLAAYLPDAGEKDRVRTEDGKWTVAWQRGESILAVFGAPTEDDAERLLKGPAEKLTERR